MNDYSPSTEILFTKPQDGDAYRIDRGVRAKVVIAAKCWPHTIWLEIAPGIRIKTFPSDLEMCTRRVSPLEQIAEQSR